MSKGFIHAYNDFSKGSIERGDLDQFAPSMTRQEFAEECDINTIMARYEASGALSHVNRAEPLYMDFTEVPPLREAMAFMDAAAIAFNSLPASVRAQFGNDPVAYVDFAQKSENIGKMREWGLAPPVVQEAPPTRVEIVGEFKPPVPANDVKKA